MTTYLVRHFPKLRDRDGAVPWEKLMKHFNGFREQIASWTGRITYLRSIQVLSGGVHIDPKLQNSVQIPYGWTDYIYRVWVIMELQVHIRRRTYFLQEVFTAVSPKGKPRMTLYSLTWRRVHNASHHDERTHVRRLLGQSGQKKSIPKNKVCTKK